MPKEKRLIDEQVPQVKVCIVKRPALLPDPGQNVTHFLAWLKKRGMIKSLDECKRKWDDFFDVEKIVKDLGVDNIMIGSIRGKWVVYLKNEPWADQWAGYYKVKYPHHSQNIKLEPHFKAKK